MVTAAVTVRRERRGVYHATYSDGGVEGHLLRFVVRGDLPAGTPVTVGTMHTLLQGMPVGASMHAVYEALIGRATASTSGRFQPEAVSAMLSLANLLVERCELSTPEAARELIRQFNAATYQVFRGNEVPIREMAQRLERGPAAT